MPPAITDVPGVLVGHAHNVTALTGCSVILTLDGAVGGVDVRGGAPGSRETDLLDPIATVAIVHAITLCGGSAFGLAAATGVVDWLRERNIGYETRIRRVPIVPAAVIFDLGIGSSDTWPDLALGHTACDAAGTLVAEGCVGVGMGATVGKLLGMGRAMKTGVGTWSETLADGTVVGALVVCNAFGDVHAAASGQILAGARNEDDSFAHTIDLLRRPEQQQQMAALMGGENTTLAVVATDAKLTKAEATKMAQMAQDALPRTIRPVHTPFDGDTVFALATGRRRGQHVAVLGAIAAEVLAQAIERCATEAVGMGGLPAARDIAI